MTKTKRVKLYYSIAWDVMICPKCDLIYSIDKGFRPPFCTECNIKAKLKQKEAQNEKTE